MILAIIILVILSSVLAGALIVSVWDNEKNCQDVLELEEKLDDLNFSYKSLDKLGSQYFAKCCAIRKILDCRTFETVDEQKENILDILNNYELSIDDAQINNK